ELRASPAVPATYVGHERRVTLGREEAGVRWAERAEPLGESSLVRQPELLAPHHHEVPVRERLRCRRAGGRRLLLAKVDAHQLDAEHRAHRNDLHHTTPWTARRSVGQTLSSAPGSSPSVSSPAETHRAGCRDAPRG